MSGVKQLPRPPSHVRVEFLPVLFAGILSHYGQLGPAEIGPKRRFNPLAALRLIIAAGGSQLKAPESFQTPDMQAFDTLPIGVTRARQRQK